MSDDHTLPPEIHQRQQFPEVGPDEAAIIAKPEGDDA